MYRMIKKSHVLQLVCDVEVSAYEQCYLCISAQLFYLLFFGINLVEK